MFVATPSIRWRILKEEAKKAKAEGGEVATPSIRWRILKGGSRSRALFRASSRDPLDPLEDTERYGRGAGARARREVATPSIRWRILKEAERRGLIE